MMYVLVLIIVAVVIIAIIVSKRHSAPPQSEQKHNPYYMERMADAKRLAEERGDKEALQAILEDRYDQLMQERAEKNPLYLKTRSHATTVTSKPIVSAGSLEYNIAGINFRKGISNYVGDFEGYIKPQPRNQYDPKAIAIYHRDGHHLGYIPADETDDVRSLGMQFPILVHGNIEEDYDYDESRRFYRGTIYIKPQ